MENTPQFNWSNNCSFEMVSSIYTTTSLFCEISPMCYNIGTILCAGRKYRILSFCTILCEKTEGEVIQLFFKKNTDLFTMKYQCWLGSTKNPQLSFEGTITPSQLCTTVLSLIVLCAQTGHPRPNLYRWVCTPKMLGVADERESKGEKEKILQLARNLEREKGGVGEKVWGAL